MGVHPGGEQTTKALFGSNPVRDDRFLIAATDDVSSTLRADQWGADHSHSVPRWIVVMVTVLFVTDAIIIILNRENNNKFN